MTTKAQLNDWFDRGVEKGATHMIVVVDTWDYEDYPVYVGRDEDVQKVKERYNGKNMQRIMEVYNLSIPFDVGTGLRFDA